MDSDDRELIRQHLAGKQDAFPRLVALYQPVLERYLRRWAFLGDPDDVIQEIWARLFRALGSYDPARPFLRFLLTFARNCAIDHQRRFARQVPRNLDGQSLELASPGPEEVDLRLDLDSVRGRLSEPDRALLDLLVQGYTPGEIADHLHVSQPTVWRRTESLRRLLRHLLFDRDA